MKEFLVASASEILSGSVTDAYFERTEEILSKAGKNPEVVMELHVKHFLRQITGLACWQALTR